MNDFHAKRENGAVDVFRLVLALMVIAIHNDPFGIDGRYRYPLLLLPVPLFFIISSYFFFSKYNKLNTKKEKRNRILKLIKRNLQLYFCWFIILLPVTLIIKGYYRYEFVKGINELFRDFFLGSTFRSSWFLMANLLGILIILGISKINNIFAGILAVLLYIACMLRTCYGLLLPQDCLFNHMLDKYPTTFYQSFPIAVFWAFVGKCIAEKELTISKKYIVTCFIMATGLLVVEYRCIQSVIYTPGYCIMMVPVCIFAFLLVHDCDIRIETRSSMFFRHLSTVIYCLSTTLGFLLDKVFERIMGFSIVRYLAVYIVTLLMCGLVAVCIHRIKDRRLFRWVKFLY